MTRCDVTATSLRCRYDITVMSLSVIKVGMHALLEAVRQFCSRCVCVCVHAPECMHACMCLCYESTVVPVMNGHPRDQAKVSVHCRWPLIRGNLTLKCVGRGIDNVAVQGRWPLTTGVAQGRYYCTDRTNQTYRLAHLAVHASIRNVWAYTKLLSHHVSNTKFDW